MIVHFVDIGGIVDHYCLNFLFIILNYHYNKKIYNYGMYTWNFKFLQSILFKEQTSDRPW